MIKLRPATLATVVVLFLVGLSQAQVRDVVRTPVPRVTLNASPASLAPGGRVTFAAQLSSSYPNIKFRFDFGDGEQTGWQSSAVTTHTYRGAGNYRPFVDIGVASGSGVMRLGGSVRRLVQVTHGPVGPVDLFISPAAAGIGQPVTLSVRPTSNNPNLRYRFSFGDGAPVGGWQSGTQATHVYSTSGAFIASVDVGVMTNRGIQLQGSSRRSVSVSASVALRALRSTDSKKNRRQSPVTPPVAKTTVTKASTTEKQKSSSVKPASASLRPDSVPSPSLSPQEVAQESTSVATTVTNDSRKYLWLLLPLALLAFILGKWLLGKPELRTHADPGTARVVNAESLVRNAQVVTSGGAREVGAADSLVKNVRREDG